MKDKYKNKYLAVTIVCVCIGVCACACVCMCVEEVLFFTYLHISSVVTTVMYYFHN